MRGVIKVTPEPSKVEQGYGVKSDIQLAHINLGDYAVLRSAYVQVEPTAVTPSTSAEYGVKKVSTNELAPKK